MKASEAKKLSVVGAENVRRQNISKARADEIERAKRKRKAKSGARTWHLPNVMDKITKATKRGATSINYRLGDVSLETETEAEYLCKKLKADGYEVNSWEEHHHPGSDEFYHPYTDINLTVSW